MVLGFALVLAVGNGALGQTAQADLYSVAVNHYGQQRVLLVDRDTRVANVLEALRIKPGHLDIVLPAPDTLIDRDDFPVTVEHGHLVEVIDGDERFLAVAPKRSPREIVLSLGYELRSDDAIVQHAPVAPASVVLEIKRSGDYQININGQLSLAKATARSVASILEELGHGTDGIAYVRPHLHKQVGDSDQIVVYYDQPDQSIVIETRVRHIDGQLIEKEYVYQVLYDDAGLEMARNLIEEYIIRQVPLASLTTEEAAGNPEQTTSHRVGDLDTQQQAWLRQAGIAEADWFYVDYIIFHESRWRHQVWNSRGSSAYGLCQALPASKMSSFGADYLTNPITQLRWCDWYAKDRYGGWQAAYQSWLVQRWW